MTQLDPLLRTALEASFDTFKNLDEIKAKINGYQDLIPVAMRFMASVEGSPNGQQIKHLQDMFRELANVSAVRLKEPAARITVAKSKLLKELERLEKYFWLRVLDTSDKRKIDLELVMFSAVRYGGLLYEARIQALSSKLAAPVDCFGDAHWYELSSDKEPYPVRWQPDNLTLALIAQYKKQHKQRAVDLGGPRDWFRDLRSFDLRGLSRSKFIEACAAALSLKVPSALVDSSRLINDTRCLQWEPFMRLLSQETPPLNTSVQEQLNHKLTRPEVHVSSKEPSFDGREIQDARLMREAGVPLRINSGTRKEVKEAVKRVIETYRDSCSPIAVLLCEWSAHRLTETNRWGNKCSPATAYTRRGTLRHLACQYFGLDDPLKASAQQLNDAYAEIIDCAESSDQRIKLSKCLRDFHDYIENRYGVESLDEDGPWLWLSPEGKNVDAKVVWPHEYHAARNYLIQSVGQANTPEQAQVLRSNLIALILGYRCGMRRSEIRFLHRDAVVGERKLEILVRPSFDYNLKSVSSNRRLPISVLLSGNEIQLLKQWLEDTQDAKYLLPRYDDNQCCSADTLFDPIQHLLKQVTGDAAARFHHLRHSVATINFCRWMLFEQKSQLNELLIEPDIDIAEQRRVILGEGPKSNQRILHALSMMLGHSGPKMTLIHYIHSADLLAKHFCDKALPDLNQEQLGQVMGVSGRWIRKRIRSTGRVGIHAIKDITHQRLGRYSNKQELTDWKSVDSTSLHFDSLALPAVESSTLRLWHALCAFSALSITSEQVAERYSVNHSELQAVIAGARIVMDIKHTTHSYKTPRHHLPHWRDFDQPPVFFQLPSKEKDRLWVHQMLAKYETLNMNDREVVNDAVTYFIENGQAREGDIPFNNTEDLERFLCVFDLLDLNPKINGKTYPTYKLVLRHRDTKESADRSASWEYWLKAAGLIPMYRLDKIKESHSAPHGVMSLRILAKKPRTAGVKKTKRPAAWGFRLGLYVLAVTSDFAKKSLVHQ